MEIERIVQLRARLEKALLNYMDGKNKILHLQKDMRFVNPKSDVYIDGNRQLVFLETPAIVRDSIKTSVVGDEVIFSAEKIISRNSIRKYLQIERTVGTFMKSIPLVFRDRKIKNIDHSYKFGVVKIEIEYGDQL